MRVFPCWFCLSFGFEYISTTRKAPSSCWSLSAVLQTSHSCFVWMCGRHFRLAGPNMNSGALTHLPPGQIYFLVPFLVGGHSDFGAVRPENLAGKLHSSFPWIPQPTGEGSCWLSHHSSAESDPFSLPWALSQVCALLSASGGLLAFVIYPQQQSSLCLSVEVEVLKWPSTCYWDALNTACPSGVSPAAFLLGSWCSSLPCWPHPHTPISRTCHGPGPLHSPYLHGWLLPLPKDFDQVPPWQTLLPWPYSIILWPALCNFFSFLSLCMF